MAGRERGFILWGPGVPGRLRKLTPAGRRQMVVLLRQLLDHQRRQGPAVPIAVQQAARGALEYYRRPLFPRPGRAHPLRRMTPGQVASPGGWKPPAGSLPGWNWTPPQGVAPRLDLAPRWVRAWYWTPFLDRYAHMWLWEHGYMEIEPPSA